MRQIFIFCFYFLFLFFADYQFQLLVVSLDRSGGRDGGRHSHSHLPFIFIYKFIVLISHHPPTTNANSVFSVLVSCLVIHRIHRGKPKQTLTLPPHYALRITHYTFTQNIRSDPAFMFPFSISSGIRRGTRDKARGEPDRTFYFILF